MLVELGPLHHACGLIAHSAENQGAAAGVEDVGEVFQCVKPCAVDRRHITQTQDDDLRQFRDVVFELHQLVRRPKEEGTVNSIDCDIVRNVVQLKAVGLPVVDVLRRDERDRGRRRDTADIKKRRQDHAGFNGHR